MSSPFIEKLGHNLPASGLAATSQAAVGLGIGLLLSRYLSRGLRDKLAVALVAAGVATLLPLVAGVVARVANRPESAGRVRRRLESIRHDYGLAATDDESIF